MTGNEKVNQPDNELANLAAEGDAQAFEEIYRRHRRRVYAIALYMTCNHAEAEDLAQESFVTLFRKIESFHGHSAFTTWLRRLTVNQVLMHFRRRKRRPQEQTGDGEMPEHGAPAMNSLPEVERIAIERAVNALSPGYRATLILHDVEGYEHQEIARMLGCKVGTSKSQLHKARARVRELLLSPSLLPQT